MDERENDSRPIPPSPTTSLPIVEPERPRLIKNRGPALAFLIIAVIVVVGIVLTVFALVYSSNRPTSNASYIGNWSSGIQSLSIASDGEARGTDGCNGQSSRWTMVGDRIEFEGFMGTMMACLGPNHKLLNGWLSQSSSAQLDPTDPNRLIFFGQNGEQLGSMTRDTVPAPRSDQPVPTSNPVLPGPLYPPVAPRPTAADDSAEDPQAEFEPPKHKFMFPKLPKNMDKNDSSDKLR